MKDKKIAFVTGGTGVIGTAICVELVKNNYKVIAGYYSGGNHIKAKKWQEDQRALGIDIDIAFGEITSFESCKKCMYDVRDKYGSVDILINNASITRDSTFSKMSYEQWHSVINVNLDSVFVMTKLIIDDMIKNNWGRIVNISSINAQNGQFGQSNYSAAKSGVHGFTKALAQEVAKYGITVNTVSPGYFETNMTDSVPAYIKAEILKDIPIGRFGKPEELGKLVCYLIGQDASFITGANITINGGHHMI